MNATCPALSLLPVSVRRFVQVDVFGTGVATGNPVAVVLDADGLTDDDMARFARWTNLSETTFVCAPVDAAADYRLRIFTPGGELPFAGHPTLGSAHAWLSTGGRPADEGRIVQECGIGNVAVTVDGDDRFAFVAPNLLRTGEPDAQTLERVRAACGLRRSDVVAAQWVDNGPPWLGLLLTDGQRVLDVTPDLAAFAPDDFVGLIGPWRAAEGSPGPGDADYEVRAFAPGTGVPEDPVTGSLNAGLAVWLRGTGAVPERYVAAQGTALGRTGRVQIVDDGAHIWVGGRTRTVISGTVDL
ncbi:PhzF family phenazine biosynthesis protein [Gordonia alkaliphila]|uniref:PhzF family phenazine biosynthesis protein n=1 Tax=Gordonia alkaliphila TaxID=1053547 RepID=UPI001FF19CF8|nr:PhzF family phenazine biosynthesis protein [Gordonia alkaliphila]MCK0439748.1 PhzF family phenazine biosynthesis protein [Gordonia alkaliphila]